jgi:hypothetical protein
MFHVVTGRDSKHSSAVAVRWPFPAWPTAEHIHTFFSYRVIPIFPLTGGTRRALADFSTPIDEAASDEASDSDHNAATLLVIDAIFFLVEIVVGMPLLRSEWLLIN